MTRIDFYDVVSIGATKMTTAMKVAGKEGIVVGVSGEGDVRTYAVLVGGRAVMLGDADILPTGRKVDRSSVYGGESIKIQPERYGEDT